MLNINSSTRKDVEALVYKFFNTIDKTGTNTARYKKLFKSMDDKKFSKFIDDMLKDDDNNFYLEVVPYQDEPPIDDIEAALKVVGTTTEEYVFYPHQADESGKAVRTAVKVPVIYMHIKKLRQVLSKKNSFEFDVSQRSALTDQVTGDSKVSRNSDAESYALVAIGAENILREISGARADNAKARNEMYNEISSKGFSRLSNLETDLTRKASLNLFDVYLTGAGLNTDLVTDGLLLTNTTIQAKKGEY